MAVHIKRKEGCVWKFIIVIVARMTVSEQVCIM